MSKETIFIINRSEITAGTRGASLGPEAIFAAARSVKSTFFSNFTKVEVTVQNELLDLPTNHSTAKRIEGLLDVHRSVSELVSDALKNDLFPFVIAGDHGSAAGTIAGIKHAYKDSRLGVVWIDAHGDLHTPFTTPSGNMHGMPLAIALGEDNTECQRNQVPQETKELWEELKNVGVPGNKMNPQDLVFVGVRDTEKEEDALIERLGIKNFTVQEVTMLGTDVLVQKVLEKLKECDIIYVSFDVDSMDPKATSYGTGTPVKNGLIPRQAKEILNGLIQSPKTVCMELVEVNPCLDEKLNRMAEVAFELIESAVKTKEAQ